jgi:hypothetical protein
MEKMVRAVRKAVRHPYPLRRRTTYPSSGGTAMFDANRRGKSTLALTAVLVALVSARTVLAGDYWRGTVTFVKNADSKRVLGIKLFSDGTYWMQSGSKEKDVDFTGDNVDKSPGLKWEKKDGKYYFHDYYLASPPVAAPRGADIGLMVGELDGNGNMEITTYYHFTSDGTGRYLGNRGVLWEQGTLRRFSE